ncbi:phosphoesterase [Nanobdella aerobiophila]|uniref:Phosphoesterase n=1 Tax=Nanobdella aerobiophila TaxID=2586965 RepID=A0A915SZP5_9ARCH|nr:hypothetical protein [Nanobdella aerobiophila]BBL45379.1 phosphoesterase [Nanobdella aerobiophila]
MISITHWDLDGIFSLSLLYKKFGDKFKVYFSSPRLINKTLLKVIENNDPNERVYITDIATNQEAIYLSSYFKEVYWIDHHNKNYDEITKRINVYIKDYRSAARVLSEYLDINNDYLYIIDDIDSGMIRNDLERDLRDMIVAIRYFYPKSFDLYFISFAKKINIDINNILDKNILNRFRKILKDLYKDIDRDLYIIEDKYKIFIIKTKYDIPSNYVVEYIGEKFGQKPDYIITLYQKSKRGEIRTLNNKNVIEIAKIFNGNGHKFAAGFVYNNENDVYEKIKYMNNL